ncbi:hypothetical protein Tco_0955659 [Tanacetum coccineum]|uniref:Uncharacterized protein n=1 Tax=Tanacetum coccineum TaxID=301880 RepID=A0ABQ5E7Z0_9ASTR
MENAELELYMLNRPHGRMILASVEKGPLVWPSITEDGVTRLKEYVELTPAEAIQADCDIKAINIILQGLPTEIYALVSQHRVAKDLWEKIKLLIAWNVINKTRTVECKLYDEFNKFTYKKEDTLHEYYLRFTMLLNDMNIYKMPLEQFQDLHTTNVDQLHGLPFITPQCLLLKPMILVAYDSDCDDISHTQQRLSDHRPISQGIWLNALTGETVQNSNSSAQQDVLILSMFDQLTTQVTHCTTVNKALTTELDRYKEEVKDLKEKQNVENSFSGSNEQFDEIVRLKQNLFEQVQEKDCLMKIVSELKNELKLEENRNIDREIALEKKIKQLDNIIFKRGQSAQTVHMMTKSKICYDHSSKQAIGFEKPFCLKKARESKPKLYDGNTILKMDTIVVPDSDETLELSEKSRSKMLLKEQDPLFEKHKVNTKPINYAILNNDYYKRFVRQTDLYCEQAYWKATSVPPLDPSHSSTTVIVEVPKELPTVSMVNTSLKKLKRHLTGFDLVVKERTTATASDYH